MGARFFGHGEAAVGTNKTILNLHNAQASPAKRANIYEVIAGCDGTPADAATDFLLGRTTAVGTEGSGLAPEPLDPADPATEWDFGVGVFSVEPTYTATAELLRFSMNQRATFRWVAVAGGELKLPATQNNGGGFKSSASTVATTHQGAIYFEE